MSNVCYLIKVVILCSLKQRIKKLETQHNIVKHWQRTSLFFVQEAEVIEKAQKTMMLRKLHALYSERHYLLATKKRYAGI